MKKDLHPENYRVVAFKDMSNDDIFLTKSTAETKETVEVEGTEYPLVKLEISRTSHPFYTGKAKFLDTAGRIDKFKNKYDKFKKKKAATAEKPEEKDASKTEVKAETVSKEAPKAEAKAESTKNEAPKSEAKAKTAEKEAPKAETAAKEASKAEVKAESGTKDAAKAKSPKKEEIKADADKKEKE